MEVQMEKQKEKNTQNLYLRSLNKMRKIIFISIFSCLHAVGFSQKNNLLGVWQETIQDTNSYCLITNSIFYFIYDTEDFDKDDVWEEYYGFIDNRDIDSLSISQFRDSGRYFVLADTDLDKETKYDKSYFLIYGTDMQSKYNDFGVMELEGPKFFMYGKIGKLNKRLEKNLKEKSPEVFTEYLSVTSRKEIIAAKSIIYSEPDTPTKMYLIKGDVVTVLEEKEGWLKIEYEGKKLITGWIRKSNSKP
jgi:hypothetical protein